MLKIKFKYRDAWSNGRWNTQECVMESIGKCIEWYGLGKDCEKHKKGEKTMIRWYEIEVNSFESLMRSIYSEFLMVMVVLAILALKTDDMLIRTFGENKVTRTLLNIDRKAYRRYVAKMDEITERVDGAVQMGGVKARISILDKENII